MTALNIDKLERIYNILRIFPNGLTIKDLADLCDLSRGDVDSSLASMDLAGFLLYEDEHNRVYPYEPQTES